VTATAGRGAAGTFAEAGEAAQAGGEAAQAGAGANEPRGFGQISVLSLPGLAGFDGTYAVASFIPPGDANRCSRTQQGDCEFYTCASPPSVEPEDSGPIALVSALASYHVTLYPTDGRYGNDIESGIYLAEGDLLTVAAGGHTAPGFHVSGPLPQGLRLSSPALEAGATSNLIKVPRTADWVIEWEGGAADVRAQIQVSSDDVSIVCVADSRRGTLTVPAAVLALFDAGTALLGLTIGEFTVSADNYDFAVLAGVGVYTADHQRLDFELE
jgi:hypothetical protein